MRRRWHTCGMVDAAWWGARARYGEPGRYNKSAARVYLRWCAPVVRLFHRPRLEGAEHLRRDTPFLLVANHSGGLAISEISSLATLALDQLDDVRVAAMAHPIAFHLWPLTVPMRWLGAIPSTYEAAAAALADGAGVLVFPGGDHEAARPFWLARRVDFNGRKGFLRIARDAGVPIVPMGIAGSHWSVPILMRSDRVLPWLLVLPRLFGIKRFPITLLGALGVAAVLAMAPGVVGWPAALGLAWLWLASPLTLLPIVPVGIRFRIGAAIPHDELFPTGGDLDDAYARVHAAVQALVLGD